MEIEVKRTEIVKVKYLLAEFAPRYWEDSEVNGQEDTDGSNIPLRNGSILSWKIDLDTGQINEWPKGVSASIHYKVCDVGNYYLLDPDGNKVSSKEDGYVISMMCPKDEGYGDYVIMDINEDGYIQKWNADLSEFD